MEELNDRQIKLLKAIIEEYIETAEPVGSETIEKKYQLAVSPATIRNEMVSLTNMGLLNKSHKSAGRTPTPVALKYYVKHLLEPEDLPVSEEVSVKEKIWDVRHEKQRLLSEAVRTLAEKSHALALATTENGHLYHAGAANILDFPEFYDIDLTKAVLSYLDREAFWQDVSRKPLGEQPFYLVVGDEFNDEIFFPCGFLYARFQVRGQSGIIGIIGPYRLQYRQLIPIVTYFGQVLSEIG